MSQTSRPDPSPDAPQGVLLDRYDAGLALVLAATALAAYVRTLAPGLLESDGAEFQTLAATLGYAHPTGYPVYLLLARLATLIPVGDVAYRVNLLSAILGSLATAGLYLLGRLLTGRRWPAAAGALAMALAPTFWSQAIIARAYTAGIALMIGVLLCLELWRQRGRLPWLFASGCLGGVSLGVHATQGLMAPAVAVLLLLTPRRWKAQWTVAAAGALAGALITLAAYKVIDSAGSRTSYFRTVIAPSRSLPEWNLRPENLDSFWGRVNLCFRPPQYRVLLFSKPADVAWQKFAWFAGNLPQEFPWPWLAASLAGAFWLGRRDWRMTLLLLLTFAAHLGFDLIYDMGGIHVLYLATYVPLALFGVAGLALAADAATVCSKKSSRHTPSAVRRVLARLCGRRTDHTGTIRRTGRTAYGVCLLLFLRRKFIRRNLADLAAGLLGLGIVLWPLARPGAWNVEGRRECRVPPEEDPFRVEWSPTFQEPIDQFHQRVRELVHDLEPGAIVFTGWCPLYAYYYVAHVELDRTDLVFLQDYPHPYTFELADSAVEYAAEMSPFRPVYFTHVVRKVAERLEMAPVRRGRDTLYRVRRPIR